MDEHTIGSIIDRLYAIYRMLGQMESILEEIQYLADDEGSLENLKNLNKELMSALTEESDKFALLQNATENLNTILASYDYMVERDGSKMLADAIEKYRDGLNSFRANI